MRSREARQCYNLAEHRLKALGHNSNVSDLRRPCGQHGSVGGIDNDIRRNHNTPPGRHAGAPKTRAHNALSDTTTFAGRAASYLRLVTTVLALHQPKPVVCMRHHRSGISDGYAYNTINL